MKTIPLLLTAAMAIALFMWRCQTTDPEIPEETEISALLTSDSGCKEFSNSNELKTTSKISPAQSCLEYIFDSQTGILSLKHINAGFNCCPDSLFCQLKIKGDTLIIIEFEK
jgi:hypothetical protein